MKDFKELEDKNLNISDEWKREQRQRLDLERQHNTAIETIERLTKENEQIRLEVNGMRHQIRVLSQPKTSVPSPVPSVTTGGDEDEPFVNVDGLQQRIQQQALRLKESEQTIQRLQTQVATHADDVQMYQQRNENNLNIIRLKDTEIQDLRKEVDEAARMRDAIAPPMQIDCALRLEELKRRYDALMSLHLAMKEELQTTIDYLKRQPVQNGDNWEAIRTHILGVLTPPITTTIETICATDENMQSEEARTQVEEMVHQITTQCASTQTRDNLRPAFTTNDQQPFDADQLFSGQRRQNPREKNDNDPVYDPVRERLEKDYARLQAENKQLVRLNESHRDHITKLQNALDALHENTPGNRLFLAKEWRLNTRLH